LTRALVDLEPEKDLLQYCGRRSNAVDGFVGRASISEIIAVFRTARILFTDWFMGLYSQGRSQPIDRRDEFVNVSRQTFLHILIVHHFLQCESCVH
jgi:hypothetical protein